MKPVVTFAPLVLFAVSSYAQITATVTQMPDGSGEVHIRNDSAVPLSAYAVALKVAIGERETPVQLYVDAAVDPDATPLLPNQDRLARPERIRVPRLAHMPREWHEVFRQPIVTAGLFADGAIMGDPALCTRLMLRRSSTLLAIETALDVLSDAGNRNVDRDRLIEQFRKMAELAGRWYLPPEQRIGRDVYQSILGKLINLTAISLGSPFPPTAFVEQETALLRQRRAALVESRPSLADATLNPR